MTGMSAADPTAPLLAQIATLSRSNILLMKERQRLTRRNERLLLLAQQSEARSREAVAEMRRRSNPGPSIGRGDLGLVIRALAALDDPKAARLASHLAGFDWGG